MDKNIWDIVKKYFNKNENWGDPEKINGLLLLTLFNIRDIIGVPFHINCAYELNGHEKNSQHGLGNAVDGYFDGLDIKFQIIKLEQVFKLLQIEDKIGFGFYLDWHTPGIHLDVRGSKARWCRVAGQYIRYEEGKERL